MTQICDAVMANIPKNLETRVAHNDTAAQTLERAHQRIVNRHHSPRVVEFSAIIWCAEYCHKLPTSKEFIPVLHNLQRLSVTNTLDILGIDQRLSVTNILEIIGIDSFLERPRKNSKIVPATPSSDTRR